MTRTRAEPSMSTRHRLPNSTAIAVALLAIGTAAGVGQLVAGVVSPVSSPYQAVADAVVRYAPSGLIEFGKTLTAPGLPAGQADKVALLVGVGSALLLIAVVAGLGSRYRERFGRRTIIITGLIGVFAVVTSPVFSQGDLFAPLVALGIGMRTFRYLHAKALTQARQSDPDYVRTVGEGPDGKPTPDSVFGDVSRRDLFVTGAAVGATAVGAGLGGYLLGAGGSEDREEVAAQLNARVPALPPVPAGADFASAGTPTFLTSNRDFYRIDTALRIPARAAADWSMQLHGMVERPITISYADLLKRPLVQRPVTLTCVSNPVGGNLISTANFIGVSLRDLLLEAGVKPGADQLFSTSFDGFTAGTPTDVVMEPNRGAMLALGMNGEALPLEHGFPVRMVVPGLYGFVSATKWLAGLELTTFAAKQSYWLLRGWAKKAPIKTQSRIDRPRTGATVAAGPMTAAGIAWAPHRGISAVEVRLDDGPWRPARLSTEVSSDTWRMWMIDLVVSPGQHTLESRAADGTGQLQPPIFAPPIPDGASGDPVLTFTAR